MKIHNIIKRYAGALAITFCVTSCSDYLDVVPPEQAKLRDAVKNYQETLAFLYSCYGGVGNPVSYYAQVEAASDEFVLPPLWNEAAHKMLYDLNAPATIADGWSWGNAYYRFIGQCHLFMQELPYAKEVTDAQREEFAAEVDFLLGYYHMYALLRYGPCPINDKYIAKDADASEYPGRSHFDYVVNWIVDKFDKAAAKLPASRSNEAFGRATSTAAKALKARLLVYAASPLWNGSFPYPEWKNKNFETPGYGKDLVSLTYDASKWERARVACQEALDWAINQGGNALYSDEEYYNRQGINLPFVPGVDANTADGKAFLKKVMLMRYLVTTRTSEGNREFIWSSADQGYMVTGSLPHGILQKPDGTFVSGYSGVSPVLNTSIQYFYTNKGKRPAHDNTFTAEANWYKSANITGRTDIINLNVGREPRFYAWFAFDGGDYGNRLDKGNPLRIDLKNGDKQGYNPSRFNRDNNVTGYFSQKYVNPTHTYSAAGAVSGNEAKPRPLIRLAELYLNLAECYAAQGNVSAAITNLNVIRNRAGVPDLTTADLSSQNIMDWVRNERFIEFWNEGHRYYDVRRWMIAPQTMGAGMRLGLSAYGKVNPTFAEFNTVKPIAQDYRWTNRMYLLPLFHIEVYKNPQFVQAPGY